MLMQEQIDTFEKNLKDTQHNLKTAKAIKLRLSKEGYPPSHMDYQMICIDISFYVILVKKLKLLIKHFKTLT